MPKYRHLTKEELESLEKEFVEYLIVNGITADDWESMKHERKEDAEKIVSLFSDVVFEGIMRKTQFLEYRSKKELKAFQCLADQIVMMALEGDEHADFTDEVYVQQSMASPPEGIKIFSARKAYNKQRELELFDMIQQGCQMTDGKIFKALSLVYAEIQAKK